MLVRTTLNDFPHSQVNEIFHSPFDFTQGFFTTEAKRWMRFPVNIFSFTPFFVMLKSEQEIIFVLVIFVVQKEFGLDLFHQKEKKLKNWINFPINVKSHRNDKMWMGNLIHLFASVVKKPWVKSKGEWNISFTCEWGKSSSVARTNLVLFYIILLLEVLLPFCFVCLLAGKVHQK